MVKSMMEKDPSRGFSSDAIDVLIKVVTCFGPLLQESELAALQVSVMAIIQNDTAGTVVTKRALTAISALVLHFSDNQLNGFVSNLTKTLSSNISMVQRRHLIAAIGVIALSLIHISEPTRRTPISYAVFCLKKKSMPSSA